MTGNSGVALSVCVRGSTGELLGYLEIDRIVGGRCCGGVRMTPTVGPAELRRLARGMTLKCGYLGLVAGGAKAGIIAHAGETPEARETRLQEFGAALAPILRAGLYSFGSDLGTSSRDVSTIRCGAGLYVETEKGNSSGELAGIGVALAAVAALEARGIPARGARVAVQGAGSVGLSAIAILHALGARIVAVATAGGTLSSPFGLEIPSLMAAAGRHGDDFVGVLGGTRDPKLVLDAECDVFIPCAGGQTVDAAAAGGLRADAVVCGANDPFGDGAEEMIQRRGILVVPDFVANGGGVLGSTLEYAIGATRAEVEELFRRSFLPRVRATLAMAAQQGVKVEDVARRQALGFLARCDEVYRGERPPSLLCEALAEPPTLARRALLQLEKRARWSRRLAPIARALRPQALGRVLEVLASAQGLPNRRGGGQGREDGPVSAPPVSPESRRVCDG